MYIQKELQKLLRKMWNTQKNKEKHLEDALAHLVDMDTTREIGTVIREY